MSEHHLTAEQQALSDVLASDPANHPLRLLLARSLADSGAGDAAVEQYAIVAGAGGLPDGDRKLAAELALAGDDLASARLFLEAAPVEVAPVEAAPVDAVPVDAGPERIKEGPVETRGEDLLDAAPGAVSFDDIGGLTDVKTAINRLIVQPLERPDLFEKYGKKVGGGVLLYGPPGCGKTMIAKATASELGLPFYNVRVEDIVDPYFGVSEQRLADAFEAARELRPCVLFIDELDSLGFARSKQRSDRARALVEVLLQQLDSIGSDNAGILVLSASNEPWDIDTALMRPGRFDRTIFVPPPDADARRAIIERRLASTPHHDVSARSVVKSTELFSGADLVELFERALEEVIEHALDTGDERPLTSADIEHALVSMRATTVAWLSRARNHADFGNVGGRWDDVERYLKQRHVAKRLRRNERDGQVPPD